MTEIKTERLLLKSTLTDIDRTKEMFSEISAANEIEAYFGIPTKEEIFSIKFPGFFNIYHNEQYIGYVALHRDNNKTDDYEAEIYIITRYRRQGFAEEALKALIGAAFCGDIIGKVDRITSSVKQENAPSRALMLKIGFVQEKECVCFVVNEHQKFVALELVQFYLTRELFTR